MKRTLDVYFQRDLVGQLVQDTRGDMTFDYAESWLAHPAAAPLSRSLPLAKRHFRHHECRAFFAGILPDQGKRAIIARNLGISPENDFAMLEQIGGECAGAVTFIPVGESLPDPNYHYRTLHTGELAEILAALPRRPLLAGEKGIRLSLAGAQDKIAVHIREGIISIPLGGAPSTHILKPAIAEFAGVVFNEALCMNLAHAIGLNTAPVAVGQAETIEYLQVKRYDRHLALDARTGVETLIRQHQEDFCQALRIVPERKYQKEGGPSLADSFALVRETSSTPVIDLQSLLDAVIFNFLIGNHDAHGKNFSLIYHSDRQTRLAPLYDVLCTNYYPELSQKMAMKIGREYLSANVTPQDFTRLAEEAGLTRPLVRRRVPELAELLLSRLPEVTTDHPVSVAVSKIIRTNCERTAKAFLAE